MKLSEKMNLKVFVLSLLLAVIVFPSFSNTAIAAGDNDPVLINIAGEEVRLSEFLRVYKKNNLKEHIMTKEALEEYLELYVNFKLKVKEAVDMKMDTVPAFITELDGYRKQLAEPYLTDKLEDDRLTREAYERMQTDIRAAHILFRVAKDASPEDTLAAYNNAMKALNRIKQGEDYGAVAADVSEDPSARDREASQTHPFLKGNEGDLGFFSVFDMVYPFENGAYATPIGKVSKPIRTDYGYHLIKVNKKQKAMGKAQVAHIYVKFPADNSAQDSAAAREKIWEAYKKIQDGEIYDDVVMAYSDDKSTSKKGGVLSRFGSNRMVPEFIEAVYILENIGDISPPFTTNYGWHIIKLIERNVPGTFEEEEPDIRKKLSKDARSQISKDSFLRKVKKQYNFLEDSKALSAFYDVVDDSIFIGEWNPEKAAHFNGYLFAVGDMKYTQQDFVVYLNNLQRNNAKVEIKTYVDKNYQDYVNTECLKYKDRHLEDEYPEFKALMKEYHDGILLFELTDDKVWTKAVKDSSGLQAYYDEHKMNYMWGERVDVSLFTCENEKTAEKARKMSGKMLTHDFNATRILNAVNKDTVINLQIDRRKYPIGSNEFIDGLNKEPGISENLSEDGKIIFAVMHGVVGPEPKKLSEARGLITADYQNYLEEQWIKELHEKYEYVVYKDAFNHIEVE